MLLAVEELHWAEPGQLAILAALVTAARGQRIAVLFTTRLDGDPIDRAWRAKAGAIPFTAIELAPLSDAEAMRLAQAIHPDAGNATRAWITRAEGNPLFLIELARHAAESRAALPDTVQSVVQSRLDRLKPADKALAQCAAIGGQRVDAELLATLAGQSAIDAARLIEAGLS